MTTSRSVMRAKSLLVAAVLTIGELLPENWAEKIEDFPTKIEKSAHIIGGALDDRRR